MLLKDDCLPNAVGKQPSMPLINLSSVIFIILVLHLHLSSKLPQRSMPLRSMLVKL